RQARLLRDDLHRLLVDERERGPQDRVAAADLVDGPPERVHVESAPEPIGARQAVDGAARLEPLEEPEALLREGERGHEGGSGRRLLRLREQRGGAVPHRAHRATSRGSAVSAASTPSAPTTISRLPKRSSAGTP